MEWATGSRGVVAAAAEVVGIVVSILGCSGGAPAKLKLCGRNWEGGVLWE